MMTLDTVTLVETNAVVPPAPVQVKEKVAVAFSAADTCMPLAGSEPLQAPDAAHAVALVEAQVRVEVPPTATTVGAALKVTVGAG